MLRSMYGFIDGSVSLVGGMRGSASDFYGLVNGFCSGVLQQLSSLRDSIIPLRSFNFRTIVDSMNYWIMGDVSLLTRDSRRRLRLS